MFCRQYNFRHPQIEIHPLFLTFVDKSSPPAVPTSTSSAAVFPGDQEQPSSHWTSGGASGSEKDLVGEYGDLEDGEADDSCGKRRGGSLKSAFRRLHRIDWCKEKEYLQQPDQLFPYYLFAAVAIAFAIIAIRNLALYNWDFRKESAAWLYANGNIACFAAILVALVALLWCFCRRTPVSCNFLHIQKQIIKRCVC